MSKTVGNVNRKIILSKTRVGNYFTLWATKRVLVSYFEPGGGGLEGRGADLAQQWGWEGGAIDPIQSQEWVG